MHGRNACFSMFFDDFLRGATCNVTSFMPFHACMAREHAEEHVLFEEKMSGMQLSHPATAVAP